jgi:hypothetical protein
VQQVKAYSSPFRHQHCGKRLRKHYGNAREADSSSTRETSVVASDPFGVRILEPRLPTFLCVSAVMRPISRHIHSAVKEKKSKREWSRFCQGCIPFPRETTCRSELNGESWLGCSVNLYGRQ